MSGYIDADNLKQLQALLKRVFPREEDAHAKISTTALSHYRKILQGISRALHRRLGERLAWYAACFRAPTQPQLQHPHPQPGVAGQGMAGVLPQPLAPGGAAVGAVGEVEGAGANLAP